MTRVLVPSGVLGLGFDRTALRQGVQFQPDIIAIDGGSTDSGPFYLGSGTSKYSRAATMSEWSQLMAARSEISVPLVIGSAGTCGTDSTVDWMLGITEEIARSRGERLRIATLKCSMTSRRLIECLDGNRVHALEHAPEISHSGIGECTNIVAVMGAEPIMTAIDSGADIVIAGRCTDTATIASLPLMNGDNAGACWHGAKIGECGALCSTAPLSGCIMLEFDHGGFTVWPTASGARCTSHTVQAHMLYENANPCILHEPGGHLDATNATYTECENGVVRVSGSQWVPSTKYTVKLEGSAPAGYRTVTLLLVRDREYVLRIEEWRREVLAFLQDKIRGRMGLGISDYSIELRLIGLNAVLGDLERRRPDPTEIGVLCMVSAKTRDMANEIARLVNPFLLHFPLDGCEELPSFAFPFSPAELEQGPQYEFRLNHVLELMDPRESYRLDIFST